LARKSLRPARTRRAGAARRPRATPLADGALVNLRGVNRSPDADPDDLVSIRLWAEGARVITVSFRSVFAVEDLRAVVEQGKVRDAGDLIAQLAEVLTGRLDTVIADLGEVVDGLEENIVEEDIADMRARIGRVRRTAIGLRRYISPQREALSALIAGRFPWLADDDRVFLGEAANRVTRMIEELDSVRERAAILNDQLTDIRAEKVAERTLVLSVASAVFLPLTFFTGLLGMNVSGIPASDSPYAFAAVALFCLALGAGLWTWLVRREIG
jgi:zinc transporter